MGLDFIQEVMREGMLDGNKELSFCDYFDYLMDGR